MKIAPLLALLALVAPAQAQTTITVDRNTGLNATPEFRFTRVPPPAHGDAATKATLTLLGGTLDGNSAEISGLTNDILATDWDQAASNVFFKPNSWGGRVRFDFGAPIEVGRINSYSWHPDTRADQLYKVFGANGNEPDLDAAPSTKLDPAKAGWKLIAFVDTRKKDESGGQFGVSIANPAGSLGRNRYLLFDFFETEADDPWGQTFYSEIDVIPAP